MHSLRDPDAWDAWLHRLTVWACYRRTCKERRRHLIELHVMPGPEPLEPIDPMASVAERDRVERRLAVLPIDQRAVIVLHFYLDLPFTEAAEILDIPVGTAKSRLHRGLASLREVMRGDPEAAFRSHQERPV